MFAANSSPASGPRGLLCPPSRRSILSIIPAALFGGWRAVSGRSKSVSRILDAAADIPSNGSELTTHTYFYIYEVEPAESPAYSYNSETTVIAYDDGGCVLDFPIARPPYDMAQGWETHRGHC